MSVVINFKLFLITKKWNQRQSALSLCKKMWRPFLIDRNIFFGNCVRSAWTKKVTKWVFNRFQDFYDQSSCRSNKTFLLCFFFSAYFCSARSFYYQSINSTSNKHASFLVKMRKRRKKFDWVGYLCRFHLQFTSSFFEKKCLAQLFVTYYFALGIFSKRTGSKKLLKKAAQKRSH